MNFIVQFLFFYNLFRKKNRVFIYLILNQKNIVLIIKQLLYDIIISGDFMYLLIVNKEKPLEKPEFFVPKNLVKANMYNGREVLY